MGKTLWISRKHLQPTKYLPQFPIWYQYSLRVLGAALGDVTAQMLPALPGEGRGVGQVNFHSSFATSLLVSPLPPHPALGSLLENHPRAWREKEENLGMEGVPNSLKMCIIN